MSLLNLGDLNETEFKRFLESFDNVLCDCDGVLWHAGVPISGVDKSISQLKKLGKNVHFVTNNSFVEVNALCKIFKRCNLDVEPQDIANPCLAIIEYLHKLKFTGNICVLGSANFKQAVKDAGFKVGDLKVPDGAFENILGNENLLRDICKDTKDIGAVIFDVDLSLSYFKLIKVLMCLQNSDVLFLVACADRTLPLIPQMAVIGPEYFIKPIQDITGREPIVFGKPSMQFNEFVVDRFNISDPSRILFIGDSLVCDIEFATKCGYKSLLVLTGTAKLESINSSTELQQIPNFYLKSLGDLHEIIKSKCGL